MENPEETFRRSIKEMLKMYGLQITFSVVLRLGDYLRLTLQGYE